VSTLHVTASCLTTCGELGSGLTTDPPSLPRPRVRDWTRWAELDRVAERHTRDSGHPTAVSVRAA
jgi:hypothetical protein